MMAETKVGLDVAFTYCVNFGSAETKRTTWDKFAAAVSKSEQFETKEQSIRRAAVVGGVRRDEQQGARTTWQPAQSSRLIMMISPVAQLLKTLSSRLKWRWIVLSWPIARSGTHRDAPRIRVMAPYPRG